MCWRYIKDIFDIKNLFGRQQNGGLGNVVFTVIQADPSVQLSCTGDITIRSTSGGSPVTATYSNLSAVSVSIQADAGTIVTIDGDVTGMMISGYGGVNDIASIDLRDCDTLTNLILDYVSISDLDLSHNTALTGLALQYCNNLPSVDLSHNTALTDLVLLDCPLMVDPIDMTDNPLLTNLSINTLPVKYLDISHNSNISNLILLNIPDIETIKTRAMDNSIATTVAQAITDANSLGDVYLNSADTYYSTIETAAIGKGWTIRNL